MIKSTQRMAAIGGALAIVGCASTPNVKTIYYLPRAQTQIQVTQTFTCPTSKDSDELSVTAAVTATTSYVPNYEAGEQFINFGGYSTPFADIDLAATRSPDKRLIGINTSSAGEGSTILQDIISLGSAIASFAAAAEQRVDAKGKPIPQTTPCSVVRAHFTGDASKTPPSLAINYIGNIRYGDPADRKSTPSSPTSLGIEIDPETTPTARSSPSSAGSSVTLLPDPASASLVTAMRNALPSGSNPFAFTVSVAKAYGPADDASWAGASGKYTPGDGVLMLSRVFNADLKLSGPTFSGNGQRRDGDLWRGTVQVPTRYTYALPLPTPALFGKTQFTLTLSDAMVITKLEYSTTGGAADATSTATALVKALQPESAEAKATDTQGKADLIYQQQRLAACKASPSACAST